MFLRGVVRIRALCRKLAVSVVSTFTPTVMTAPVAVPALDRADYGIDAPGVVRAMALLAITLLGAGLVLSATAGPVGGRFGTALLWPGGSFAITTVLMLASSRFGKLRARDRLLDRLALVGGETVLDVGCGHGLLLIGAARGPVGPSSIVASRHGSFRPRGN